MAEEKVDKGFALGMMEPSTDNPRAIFTCDVSDSEWEFCQPYLLLMKEDAPQRLYSLRELFNALHYIMRAGCP